MLNRSIEMFVGLEDEPRLDRSKQHKVSSRLNDAVKSTKKAIEKSVQSQNIRKISVTVKGRS